MAGYLKSAEMGAHPHGAYGPPHAHHSAHAHGPLPPGMSSMASLPFGLPHGLDSVGFPQGMWGKFHLKCIFIIFFCFISFMNVMICLIHFLFCLINFEFD